MGEINRRNVGRALPAFCQTGIKCNFLWENQNATYGIVSMIMSTLEFIELQDADDGTQRRRGRFEACAEHIWDEILSDHPDYLESAVLNKHVPTEFLDQLVRHESERVRESVAMKRRVSPTAMAILAVDESESVRLTITRNPKVSEEALLILAKDSNSYIAGEANERLLKRNG